MKIDFHNHFYPPEYLKKLEQSRFFFEEIFTSNLSKSRGILVRII